MCASFEISTLRARIFCSYGCFHLAQVVNDVRGVLQRDSHHAFRDSLAEFLRRAQLTTDRRRIEQHGEPRAASLERVEECVVLLGDRPSVQAVRAACERGVDEALELRRTVHGLNPGQLAGFLHRQAVTLPVLPDRVEIADEENGLLRLVAWHQDERGALLRDARQVIEVRILTVFVVGVVREQPRRRAPENQHAVRAQLLHDSGPPRRQIVLELARRGRCHRKACQRQKPGAPTCGGTSRG